MANSGEGEADQVSGLTRERAAEILELAAKSSGDGSFASKIQYLTQRINRFNKRIAPAAAEHSGLTFITRPRLNLTDPNLRKVPMLVPLLTELSSSVGFGLKCILDPDYCYANIEKARSSPIIDPMNPFMVPLGNGLVSITGWPDQYVETRTSTGGFHGEDLTTVVGSHNMNNTTELSLTLIDHQLGINHALILIWIECMRNLADGIMNAYEIDRSRKRLPYTVSIYRFTLDPTREIIRHNARALGCFPRSAATGDFFNVNEGEYHVAAASKFTVPFVANIVKENDYTTMVNFNMYVRRFVPDIEDRPELSNTAANNLAGIPYIVPGPNGNRLVFKDNTMDIRQEYPGNQSPNSSELLNLVKDTGLSAEYIELAKSALGTGNL